MTRYRTFRFNLSITPEEYLSYYEGKTSWVQVTSIDGERVRFPASALRRFVSQDGIQGTFEMTVTEDNKLVRFHRLQNW
jgi:hypothetical protein